MPTVITHACVAGALGAVSVGRGGRMRVAAVAGLCAVLPDADVIAFQLGIPYGHMLGHRGLSHSLAFALLLAASVTWTLFRGARWRPQRMRLLAVFFAATASHGLFDAMTDGGLGVAFFAPFDAERYFLPFRPIAVSPLGVARFVSARGAAVLTSELLWLWLPVGLLILGLAAARRFASAAAPDRGTHGR